jgi:hypothetical protein
MTKDHPVGKEYYYSQDYQNCPGASFWHIKAISHGALPVKTKYGTIFPNSEEVAEFFCTGWEIIVGLKTGTLEIFEALGMIPRRTETMKPYVDKFFAERVEAKNNTDQIGDIVAKIFMNSLYGKYGSNPDEYREYKIIASGADRGDYDPHIRCGDYEIVQRDAKNKQYFDVALAASVTGEARAKLWLAICESKNVFYCDTDSILCEKFTGKTGDKLGEWKLEAEIVKTWIAGKKCYALQKKDGTFKTAHKGVSKMDIEVKDIMAAAAGESVEIEKSAPNMKFDGSQRFFSRKIKKT